MPTETPFTFGFHSAKHPWEEQVYILHRPVEVAEDLSGKEYIPSRQTYFTHRNAFFNHIGARDTFPDSILIALELDPALTTYCITGIGGHGLVAPFTLYALTLKGKLLFPQMGELLSAIKAANLDLKVVTHSHWQKIYGKRTSDYITLACEIKQGISIRTVDEIWENFNSDDAEQKRRFINSIASDLQRPQRPFAVDVQD